MLAVRTWLSTFPDSLQSTAIQCVAEELVPGAVSVQMGGSRVSQKPDPQGFVVVVVCQFVCFLNVVTISQQMPNAF